jgi:hypothetical protein
MNATHDRVARLVALVNETIAHEGSCADRVAGSMRRLLESIGLQRRPRGVGPSLSDIIHEGDQP